MTMQVSGAAGLTFPDSTIQPSAAGLGKNKVINGEFKVAQRGFGLNTYGPVPATTPTYPVDDWFGYCTQASKLQVSYFNTAGNSPSLNNKFYLAASCLATLSPAAGDYCEIIHRIEGINSADFQFGTARAQSLTISFWAIGTTGTYSLGLSNAASTRSIYKTFTLATGVAKFVTLTFPGDTTGTWNTDNQVGINLIFGLAAGTTVTAPANDVWGATGYACALGTSNFLSSTANTFYITDVQVEVGTVASPMERRIFEIEQALCQRYYWAGTGGQALNPTAGVTNISASIRWPVTMRTVPTVAVTSGTASYTNAHGFTSFLSTAGGAWYDQGFITASADL